MRLILHINENSNGVNNTGLGGSITTDEPSINRATLTDEGRISEFFCSNSVRTKSVIDQS